MNTPCLVKTQPFFGGQALSLHQDGNWALAEVEYVEARSCKRHVHRRPFLSMVVAGGYAERFGTRGLDFGPFQIGFHPEGMEHADTITTPGTRILIAELNEPWLQELMSEPIRSGPAMGSPRAAWLATKLMVGAGEHERVRTLAIESALCEVIGALQMTTPDDRRRPAWLGTVIEVIHEEFDTRLTIRRLARSVDRHPVHVSRAFRRFQGIGIGEYVAQVRIAAALRALSRRGASLAEVALEAGFADQSRFTRVVKANTGATPGQILKVLGRLEKAI